VVAAHLNFSRAAEELLLTQPAVTQQVKTLENEYGVSLFDRAGGHIALTASGKALLPYALKLKEISDEASVAVANASGRLGGQLAVGASQTIGQYLLPAIMAEFLSENPRVAVSARSANTDEIIGALTERAIDLALIEGPAVRKDIHTEPFMQDHMVLVVPASHEWAEQEIDLPALKEAPLLIREFGSGSRRIVERALNKAGMDIKDMKVRMELDSTEGLLSGVEAGLGVAFVSRWAVRNQLALGTLRLTKVKGVNLSRMFSIAYPIGPEPAGNAGAFREFLHARAAELMSGARRTGTRTQIART
jgi:LysR family transcriptional regulator, transcriptional activator of the cysJI operon